MNKLEFDMLVQKTLNHALETLLSKEREYATDDRLHNFKVAAQVQDKTPIQALAGMMAKHTVSIYDMCEDGNYPLRILDEKIGDHINYLLLLRALVQERAAAEETNVKNQDITGSGTLACQRMEFEV